MPEKKLIKVEEIELEASVQVRARGTLPQTVSEYAHVLETEGWVFPDVKLFDDGDRYWIGEGFHRIMAAAAAKVEVQAVVAEGGREEALKCALGSNADHGLRRTTEDKVHAIRLAFEEFGSLSDRVVADLVQVSVPMVSKHRPADCDGPRTGLDGKQYPAPAPKEEKAAEERADLEDGAEGADPEEERTVPLAGGKWVRVDARPAAGELKAAVCAATCPTWGELAEGSGLEPIAADFGGVVATALDREEVRMWCRKPATPEEVKDRNNKVVKVVGEPRWDGFRAKPVALEHAEREREKWLKEQKRSEDVVWLRELLRVVNEMPASESGWLVLLGVMCRQVLHHVPVESVAYAGMAAREEMEEFRGRIEKGDGTVADMLALLLGFQLFETSVEEVEQTVVRGLLDWVAGVEGGGGGA